MTLLSIVTATLNARSNILRRLSDYSSIFPHPHIEWIIQDSSRSVDQLESLNLPENTFLEQTDDTGIYSALNKAIERAKGKWILVLGSDDYINVSAMHLLIERLSCIQDDRILLIDYKLSLDSRHMLVSPGVPNYFSFSRGMPFSHQCMICPKKLFQHKKFSLTYKFASDFDWILYFFTQSYSFEILKTSSYFVCMSIGGISSSLAYRRPICIEFIRILKYYNFNFLYRSLLYLSLLKTTILSKLYAY